MPNPELCLCDGFLGTQSCAYLLEAFKEMVKADPDGKKSWVRKLPMRKEISALTFRHLPDAGVFALLTELRKRIVSTISRFYGVADLYPEYTLLTNNGIGDRHVLHADAEKYVDDHWAPNHTPRRSHTGMLYLNSGNGTDFAGGEIDFPNLRTTIIPTAGLLVGFKTDHTYVHQVFPVQAGQRFALSLWMTQQVSHAEPWQGEKILL